VKFRAFERQKVGDPAKVEGVSQKAGGEVEAMEGSGAWGRIRS
jgi:hypothetical protein